MDNTYSVGTNNLIKEGAILVTDVEDIFKSYPHWKMKKTKSNNSLLVKKEFQKIYEILFFDKYLNIDEIIRKIQMPAREAITKLTLMELQGIIEQEIGKGFRKKL